MIYHYKKKKIFIKVIKISMMKNLLNLKKIIKLTIFTTTKTHEKNHINNNNFIQLKFRNFLEQDKKNINDNLAKKDNIIGDNFSFRNNANINKTNLSENDKKNKTNNNLINNNTSTKNEENNINQEMIDFCKIIKSNSLNVIKINTFEKQYSQKQILRLKLEAFLVIKKYYLHRKSKSAWIKKKKKLIKLSQNF